MRLIFHFALLGLPIAILHGREALDHPNVVMIYLDDSGYGDYSHAGNPVIETPNISSMASGGANFTQFYVTSPACSASRYSLMTGHYPARSGFGRWVIGPESEPFLKTTEVTLADGLKSIGYRTGMFGKWHLGSPNPNNKMSEETFPLAHGFEVWVGTNVSHDYENALLIRSDAQGKDPIPGYSVIARNLPSDRAASTSLTSRYTDAAVEFIRSHKDEPFFAYVAYNQPHLGLFVSNKFKEKSRRGLLGDVMAEIDDSVGRILQAIDDSGIKDNTLVIFSSDNGPWLLFQNTVDGKYGEARLHVGYALPFRDGKGSNWEGGHRVPGIFYWPGVIPPRRQLEPASTLDVLPTVFALCGVTKKPDIVDGRDIRPLLAPERFTEPVAPFVLAYSGPNNQPNAIREGPWKLHIGTTSQTGDNYSRKVTREQPILFNVEEDLSERIDRASEHPEIVERLLKKLGAITASF